MKGFLSKGLVFSLFLLSTFYLLPSAAHANTITQVNNYPVANTNPDVPNNLHNWTQNVMIEVMSALSCQLAGVDPTNPKQSCLGIDQKSGKIGFLPSPQTGGAIGFMGNMIAVLYTPPLHTGDYFQNLAQNFGINKKAYAQNVGGTGFQGLTPLIGIWSAFRNIVYLLLVIVFIVIGLAIMLRIKIDPRTVMSIQNQIPKIIIGILVVTFSFAIAGFLIDLMWVFIYLIYGIFSGIPGVNLSSFNIINIQGESAMAAAGHISNAGIWGIASNATQGLGDVFKNLIGAERCNNPISCLNATLNPFNFVLKTTGIGFNVFDLIYDFISWTAGSAVFWKIAHTPNPEGGTPFISDIIGAFTLGAKTVGALGAGAVVASGTQYMLRELLPLIIIYLIVFIALLIALFRLWFTLIMAYVHILIDVVLAPFWIIGGIVPGSPISLSGWIRDIVANLAAFPAVIGMFMLGKVFMDAFRKTPASGQNFVPPLIGNPGDPSLIGSLIGLGIILMTPNVVNMLKTALKAPKLDTGGIGASLRGGAGAPIGGLRTAAGMYGASQYNPLTGEKFTDATGAKTGRFGRLFTRFLR